MKNLEDEYKRFSQEETPDLWNRIEAGLTDKKAKPKKNIFTFRYASACAAAVLLAVLLPGIYFFGMHGRKADNGAAPQNMASADTAGGNGEDRNAQTQSVNSLYEAEDDAQEDGQENEADACSAERYEPETAGRSESQSGFVQDTSDELIGQDKTDDAAQDDVSVKEGSSETPSATATPAEGSNSDAPVGNASEEGKNGGAQTVADSSAQLSGKMEVTDTEQKSGRTVYYLRTEEGEVVSAVSDEGLTMIFETGEAYLFTLKRADESGWEYVIEAAETAPAD